MEAEGISASADHPDEHKNSLGGRVERLSRPSDCCIFTVPERLRGTNKEAYKPRVIAIGPYHHDDPRLMPMENHKLWYLKNFLQHQNCHLNDYIERIKFWEGEARNCYDKQIGLKSGKFVEMMVLDGIFVIQLFLMFWKHQRGQRGDRIFNKPYMFSDVRRDMALLENQMPFFIIQQLFEMRFGVDQDVPGLLELACWFFRSVMRMEKLPQSVMETEVKHFVHMIRLSFFPLERKVSNENYQEMKFPPSATDLVAAGVKLRRGESKCLFDIKFENGVLKIPYLTLYDRTESDFRNIIAFEQCYHQEDRHLIDYMAFMDNLVNTPGDAKLLIKKRIIESWLSNEEAAANLINTFCKEANLSAESQFFYSLSHELHQHCDKPYNKWKAMFKRDYCSSPWVVISVIAAVLLLLLTVAQTVCSVLSLI